jgi:hypothetical protein
LFYKPRARHAVPNLNLRRRAVSFVFPPFGGKSKPPVSRVVVDSDLKIRPLVEDLERFNRSGEN